MTIAALISMGALLGAGALTGCGDGFSDGSSSNTDSRPPSDSNNNGAPNGGAGEDENNETPTDPSAPEPDPGDDFVPEEEEFLVREVATTGAHVFVPNSAEDSNTVAMIDGRDFSIRPMPVGSRPTVVRAAEVEGVGDVAYVLGEGDSTVAVIRAQDDTPRVEDQVNLLRVPNEVNSLALSPDGRHLLAYIDPNRPLRDESSIASLQTAALIRLGDSRAEDRVFELSVTRLIRQVEFSADSDWVYLVGQEGINQIELADIQDDTMISPLPLRLSNSDFPAMDFDVTISPSGDFLVARHSEFEGVLLYSTAENTGENSAAADALRVVELNSTPTDITLFTDADGAPALLATLRDSGEVAIVDIDATFEAEPDALPAPTILSVDEVQPGLAKFTPQGDQVLLYSTLIDLPNLGILDIISGSLRYYPLRNRIRSVAVAPDSQSAVIVHRKREGYVPSGGDPLEFFQYSHGLTLLDLPSGYRRPVVLDSEPADLLMVQTDSGTPMLYVMQPSTQSTTRGFNIINMKNYRTDFYRLSHQPEQLGRVADKIFISQASRGGRITFVDINTGAQRTVSGFELNAGIH